MDSKNSTRRINKISRVGIQMIYKIFLSTILILILSACRENLIHDLEENEANRLLANLYAVNIDANKEQQTDGRWSIKVRTTQAPLVMNYLSESHLIKEETRNNFEKNSILSSRDEQKFKYERAISNEIEYTLANIDNVLQARVHLNLPVKDPFMGRKVNKNDDGSGSVLLVVTENFHDDIKKIQDLVAGASGLRANTISVLLNKKNITKNILDSIKTNKTSIQKFTVSSFFSVHAQIIISLIIIVFAFLIFRKKKNLNRKNTFREIANRLQTNTIIRES